MSLMLIAGGAFALGAGLASAWFTHLRRRRERDLSRLRDFLETVGADAIDRRAPDEFAPELARAVNAMLDAISPRYKIAERRGMEWEKAVDALDDVVCVLDSQGRIVRANRSLAARIGVDVRKVRGMMVEELLYANPEDARDGPVAVTRASEKPASGRVARSPLGRDLELTTAHVRRDYGESMICLVFRDARDERPGDSRTRKMGHMVGAMKVPVIVADAVNGRALYVNEAFKRAFGYDEISVKGLNVDHLVPGGDEQTRLALRAVAHEGAAPAVFAQLKRADGARMDTRVHGSVLQEDGRVSTMMLMIERAHRPPTQSPEVDATSGPVQDSPGRPVASGEAEVGAEAV